MINKNTIKLIKSLASKKNRVKEKLFLVEGDKNVSEVLDSEIKMLKLFATTSFLTAKKMSIHKAETVFEVSQNEIKQASLLKNPQNSLAICNLPDEMELPGQLENLNIYLDGIQDPGNLGTILRICDWFGVNHLFCSFDTVDLFNPKVIQASMGSFCRLKAYKASYDEIEKKVEKTNTFVYGAFLDGKNIYEENFHHSALVVLGNEGNGIRMEIEKKIMERIRIPSFSKNSNQAESLNVSIAAAIFCSEFMRQNQFPYYSK